jgi:hypothetical protein
VILNVQMLERYITNCINRFERFDLVSLGIHSRYFMNYDSVEFHTNRLHKLLQGEGHAVI